MVFCCYENANTCKRHYKKTDVVCNLIVMKYMSDSKLLMPDMNEYYLVCRDTDRTMKIDGIISLNPRGRYF